MKLNYILRSAGLLMLCLVALNPVVANASADKKDSPPDAEQSGSKQGADNSKVATIPDAATKPVIVTNSVVIAGQRVAYAVETGMLPLLATNGESRASVFYVAYTRLVESDKATRPVVFCFNGGPGSSSVWLHLGGLGPRRVKMNEDGTLPPPPFGLVDNEYSILDAADLVFIDPVATGFSRPAKDEKPTDFFGQSPDVESVGEFIRLWTTRNERWRSAKYLCGESYGVFRAAGLAEHLHDRYGMYLNGVVFVSGLLDFATLSSGPGNDLPYIVFLPAYTATAFYHKKLADDLQQNLDAALAESRNFATHDYTLALLRGSELPAPDRTNIVNELARLTGLPKQLIEDNDLRVPPDRFREFLLRDEGLIIGRYDGRITGRDADKSGLSPLFDPSYAATYGPFSAAMNAYVREELQFTNDLPYEIIAGVISWQFDARRSYPSVTDKLTSVLNQNPYLRVLVLGGLRDLACPMDGIRYSLDHMQLAPEARKNISFAEYQSGHMMYVNLPDLKKLHGDLESFLKP